MPNGFPGVLTGAAIVFFTYIGFDSVSTAAEECRQPQRDLPLGIIVTLVVCAVLYISVALVLTGIAHLRDLNNAAPVANALKALGYRQHSRSGWASGAVVGMISSLLVFQYGQARVWFAMSRDGLLPQAFSQSAPGAQDAARQHLDRGFVRGHSGGHLGYRHLRRPGEYRYPVRLHHRLGRRHRAAPEAARPAARLPRARRAVCCLRSRSLFCLILMMALPLETWVRFFVWLVIGLAIYFPFGRKHSTLANG